MTDIYWKRMIYAKDLSIAWSDDSRYWSWLPVRENMSSEKLYEVAVLEAVCWLGVSGNFDTRQLAPDTNYEVVFVVKLEDGAYGWETPVNLKLTFSNSRAKPQERSVSLKEHIGKRWINLTAGEFKTPSENSLSMYETYTDVGEFSFSMYETHNGHWKKGLFVKRVEIRPKN